MALLISLIAQGRAAPVEIANLKPAYEVLLKQFDPKVLEHDLDPEPPRRPAVAVLRSGCVSSAIRGLSAFLCVSRLH